MCVCVCVCARASAGSRVIISYLWFSPQIELILSLFFLLTFILKLFILFWHIADYRAFPGSSAGKESACRAGDLSSIPELGGSPGEGKAYPLPYSGLENSVDHIVNGVTKSRTQLNDFPFHSWLTMLWSSQVNSEGTREGHTCTHAPPNFLPSRLPHNTEQSSCAIKEVPVGYPF